MFVAQANARDDIWCHCKFIPSFFINFHIKVLIPQLKTNSRARINCMWLHNCVPAFYSHFKLSFCLLRFLLEDLQVCAIHAIIIQVILNPLHQLTAHDMQYSSMSHKRFYSRYDQTRMIAVCCFSNNIYCHMNVSCG